MKLFLIENPKKGTIDDLLPLSFLSYANGPGFHDHLKVEDGRVRRVNLSEWNNYQEFETKQPATVPRDGESHSATDVGIFATGIDQLFNN